MCGFHGRPNQTPVGAPPALTSRLPPTASGSRRVSLPEQHGGHGGREAGGERRGRAAGFPAGPARALLPALPPGLAGAVFFAGDQQVTRGRRGGAGDGGPRDARRGPATEPGPAGLRCRRAGLNPEPGLDLPALGPGLPSRMHFLGPLLTSPPAARTYSWRPGRCVELQARDFWNLLVPPLFTSQSFSVSFLFPLP